MTSQIFELSGTNIWLDEIINTWHLQKWMEGIMKIWESATGERILYWVKDVIDLKSD